MGSDMAQIGWVGGGVPPPPPSGPVTFAPLVPAGSLPGRARGERGGGGGGWGGGGGGCTMGLLYHVLDVFKAPRIHMCVCAAGTTHANTHTHSLTALLAAALNVPGLMGGRLGG